MASPEQEKKAALEKARDLEADGDPEGALLLYRKWGAGEDVVRVLVATRKFGEAGKLLLASLGVEPAKVGTLDAPRKKRAMQAAICFANSGETHQAVELFLGLGERARAVETLEKAGDYVTASRIEASAPGEANIAYAASVQSQAPATTLSAAQKLEAGGKYEPALEAYVQLKQFGHAGRMAHLLKRTTQAAELFEQGGMPYEAAVCYRESGDTGKCLDNLLRVPRDDKRYRNACIHAVKLASELNMLDFQLEHFMGKFVAAGPSDDRELDTFYTLAELYRAHDFGENARDVYGKIVARNPAYKDAAAKLKLMDAEARGSAGQYEKILRDEQTFKDGVAGALAPGRPRVNTQQEVDLPDDLPDLPELPSVTARASRAAAITPIVTSSSAPVPGSLSAAANMARPASSQAGAHAPTMTPVPTPLPVSPSGPFAAHASTAPGRSSQAPGTPSQPGGPGTAFTDGAMVAGRYRLEKKIGQGGMAAVYRAMDLELEEVIAIKFFSHMVADEQMLIRFKSEVSLSRQLNHPNIIRLYDIGTYLDYKYITMELLTGNDLNKHLDGKAISFDNGLDYLIQACLALQMVHDRKVIHRDIKPDNFFITTDGNLKVMDFGIAKRTAAKGVTVAGMIAGTPEYMSPEQINDFGAVNHLTDLYALGCIAYQMFTGTLPFVHEELMPLLVMHVTQAPEPPRIRNPRIPLELEQVILKLLEKDPGKRIQSCRELGQKLGEIRRRLPGNR